MLVYLYDTGSNPTVEAVGFEYLSCLQYHRLTVHGQDDIIIIDTDVKFAQLHS